MQQQHNDSHCTHHCCHQHHQHQCHCNGHHHHHLHQGHHHHHPWHMHHMHPMMCVPQFPMPMCHFGGGVPHCHHHIVHQGAGQQDGRDNLNRSYDDMQEDNRGPQYASPEDRSPSPGMEDDERSDIQISVDNGQERIQVDYVANSRDPSPDLTVYGDPQDRLSPRRSWNDRSGSPEQRSPSIVLKVERSPSMRSGSSMHSGSPRYMSPQQSPRGSRAGGSRAGGYIGDEWRGGNDSANRTIVLHTVITSDMSVVMNGKGELDIKVANRTDPAQRTNYQAQTRGNYYQSRNNADDNGYQLTIPANISNSELDELLAKTSGAVYPTPAVGSDSDSLLPDEDSESLVKNNLSALHATKMEGDRGDRISKDGPKTRWRLRGFKTKKQ